VGDLLAALQGAPQRLRRTRTHRRSGRSSLRRPSSSTRRGWWPFAVSRVLAVLRGHPGHHVVAVAAVLLAALAS
jgi:hypothetical protein